MKWQQEEQLGVLLQQQEKLQQERDVNYVFEIFKTSSFYFLIYD